MRPKSRFALTLLPFLLAAPTVAMAEASNRDCQVTYEWKLDSARQALAAHPEDRLYEFTDDQLAGFKAGLKVEADSIGNQLLLDAIPHIHNVLVLENSGGAEFGFMFDDCFVGPDKITPERWIEIKSWAHLGLSTYDLPSGARFNFPDSYLLRI
jgi:hypothetical protein